MVISGILLKANEARLITLNGSRDSHTLVSSKVDSLSLPKNPSQEDVIVFSQAFTAYCTDNRIDQLVINRRLTAGKGAGGAGTFILEGVLLAISKVPIKFVPSATIRATDRREKEKKTERPTTVDLGKAYDLSFEGLS